MAKRKFWELLITIIVVGIGASLIVFNNQISNTTNISKTIIFSIGIILVALSFLVNILKPYLR